MDNVSYKLEISCLDKGFVRLVDYMGDDNAIVQSARVSYGKGTKSVQEDRGLIRYLMRHRHTSPFEMVEFKFHVKLPVFVARQWIRHRTANVNEYSGRYSEMKDEFYIPDLKEVRSQSSLNKQGRSDEPVDAGLAEEIVNMMESTQKKLFEEYSLLLDKEVARELARINLPLSNYTEWYWKIDLHNLFHFLRLRLDDHAQYEIRVYAKAISEIVKQITPLAWEAFDDYNFKSATFSNPELKILQKMINKDIPEDDLLIECGLSKREIVEFRDKLNFIKNI